MNNQIEGHGKDDIVYSEYEYYKKENNLKSITNSDIFRQRYEVFKLPKIEENYVVRGAQYFSNNLDENNNEEDTTRRRSDSLDSFSNTSISSATSYHSGTSHKDSGGRRHPYVSSSYLKKNEEYNVKWVNDAEVNGCMICRDVFTWNRRRHHCRSCGNVVCSICSTSRKIVYGLQGIHRVCDECLQNGVWTDPNLGGIQHPEMDEADDNQKENMEKSTLVEELFSKENFRKRICQFYKLYAPHKISQIEKLLLTYSNDLEGLFQALHVKYGVPYELNQLEDDDDVADDDEKITEELVEDDDDVTDDLKTIIDKKVDDDDDDVALNDEKVVEKQVEFVQNVGNPFVLICKPAFFGDVIPEGASKDENSSMCCAVKSCKIL